MKISPATLCALSLTTFVLSIALFLAACAPVRVDPNVGLPTGVLAVKGDAGSAAETAAMIQAMEGLALQYPRRPAFETAVMQQIRMGKMKVSTLSITYADGTSRVFK